MTAEQPDVEAFSLRPEDELEIHDAGRDQFTLCKTGEGRCTPLLDIENNPSALKVAESLINLWNDRRNLIAGKNVYKAMIAAVETGGEGE